MFYSDSVKRRKGHTNMYNEKTNKLEKELVEKFGVNASLAITNARIGNKGYLVRIESYGLPFTIDSFDKTTELAEKAAVKEFKKRMESALKECVFQTQPNDRYEAIELSNEEIEKLYKHLDGVDSIKLNQLKEITTARICKLENGLYECLIDCPYMNLHARSRGGTKKLAVMGTIWTAHDILTPFPIRVGRLSKKE